MSAFRSPLKVAILALSGLVLTLSGNSAGQARQRVCTPAEAKGAEAEAETLRTWDELHRSFRPYSQCDDGVIAEGYSESVIRLLVDHWNTLNRLISAGSGDSSFLRFVIRHVDPTASGDDLKKIKLLAKTQCPEASGAICDKFEKRAHSALQASSNK